MNTTGSSLIAALVVAAATGNASLAGLVTHTFGNDATCEFAGTLQCNATDFAFDLARLPRNATVVRAVLRVPAAGHTRGVSARVEAAGKGPLALRAPAFDSFDATAAVKDWVADPSANKGFSIKSAGGVDFGKAVLEVSVAENPTIAIAPVTRLTALHQDGQTFLTWQEIEDVVGADAPEFDAFDQKVLAARAKRRLVYRVYRSSKPITAGNIGEAELVREIPEVLSAWNLLEIRNTEHANQGTPTKTSPLRGGNLAKNHPMHRFRIVPGGEAIPCGAGLAVLTAQTAGARYYAVTAAIDGREAVADLPVGATLAVPVNEAPSPFPAVIYQRTRVEGDTNRSPAVAVCASWIGEPYDNTPGVSETFVVAWPNAPRGSAATPVPLWVRTSSYGGTATDMSNPGYHATRAYVKGAFTVGVTEGVMWQGEHECLGTLKGYDDGVVQNYPQRRVIAVAKWSLSRPEHGTDPERVILDGQMANWGLRHGDLFSAVDSDAHANLAIGKEAQKRGYSWGPYPKGSKNWLGIDQWEYMDLPKWIRENPTNELPFWLCHPAYGAHTYTDFGFMPWPEMIHAMTSTKRAFAAVWDSNGPGLLTPLYDLAARVKVHQSLPAFTRCSLDTSIGDGDFNDAERGGGINLWQLWNPDTILDEPGKWEVTLELRKDTPADSLTADLTPRKTQKFKAQPGDNFAWTLSGGKAAQSGSATADKWGLVTAEGIVLEKGVRHRFTLSRLQR